MSSVDLTKWTDFSPQAAAEVIRSEFDAGHYLSVYPDILAAKADPVLHYCLFGWKEGRNPRPDFSTHFYLNSNPDVAAAGINPFLHFVVAGRAEGRSSGPGLGSFDGLVRTIATPCGHEKRIASMFHGSTQYHGDRVVFDAPLVVMAFTNRCGSTLLGSYLAETGSFDPFGDEYLNAEVVRLSLEKTPRTAFVDYFTAQLEAKHAEGRLYSIKASAGQFMMLYRWNLFRLFPSVFVVHSCRDDLLAQAISFAIASQTGRWASYMHGEPADPRFDADGVALTLQHFAQQNSLIVLAARLAGVPRCTILYEHLIDDPATSLQKVCNLCGVQFKGVGSLRSSLRKQADHVNDVFARRFCAEMNRQVGMLK